MSTRVNKRKTENSPESKSNNIIHRKKITSKFYKRETYSDRPMIYDIMNMTVDDRKKFIKTQRNPYGWPEEYYQIYEREKLLRNPEGFSNLRCIDGEMIFHPLNDQVSGKITVKQHKNTNCIKSRDLDNIEMDNFWFSAELKKALGVEFFDNFEDFFEYHKLTNEDYKAKTDELNKILNLWYKGPDSGVNYDTYIKSREQLSKIDDEFEMYLEPLFDEYLTKVNGTKINKYELLVRAINYYLGDYAKYVCIAGGFSYAKYLFESYNQTVGFSDIDLFIHSCDEETANKIIPILGKITGCQIYENENVFLSIFDNYEDSKGDRDILFIDDNKAISVQIIKRLYTSPSQIIHGFDVDCCCILTTMDNKTYITERGFYAIKHAYNVLNPERMSPSYEHRLAKYNIRCMGIWIPYMEYFIANAVFDCNHIDRSHASAPIIVSLAKKAFNVKVGPYRPEEQEVSDYAGKRGTSRIYNPDQHYEFKTLNPGEQIINTFHRTVLEDIKEWYPVRSSEIFDHISINNESLEVKEITIDVKPHIYSAMNIIRNKRTRGRALERTINITRSLINYVNNLIPNGYISGEIIKSAITGKYGKCSIDLHNENISDNFSEEDKNRLRYNVVIYRYLLAVKSTLVNYIPSAVDINPLELGRIIFRESVFDNIEYDLSKFGETYDYISEEDNFSNFQNDRGHDKTKIMHNTLSMYGILNTKNNLFVSEQYKEQHKEQNNQYYFKYEYINPFDDYGDTPEFRDYESFMDDNLDEFEKTNNFGLYEKYLASKLNYLEYPPNPFNPFDVYNSKGDFIEKVPENSSTRKDFMDFYHTVNHYNNTDYDLYENFIFKNNLHKPGASLPYQSNQESYYFDKSFFSSNLHKNPFIKGTELYNLYNNYLNDFINNSNKDILDFELYEYFRYNNQNHISIPLNPFNPLFQYGVKRSKPARDLNEYETFNLFLEYVSNTPHIKNKSLFMQYQNFLFYQQQNTNLNNLKDIYILDSDSLENIDNNPIPQPFFLPMNQEYNIYGTPFPSVNISEYNNFNIVSPIPSPSLFDEDEDENMIPDENDILTPIRQKSPNHSQTSSPLIFNRSNAHDDQDMNRSYSPMTVPSYFPYQKQKELPAEILTEEMKEHLLQYKKHKFIRSDIFVPSESLISFIKNNIDINHIINFLSFDSEERMNEILNDETQRFKHSLLFINVPYDYDYMKPAYYFYFDKISEQEKHYINNEILEMQYIYAEYVNLENELQNCYRNNHLTQIENVKEKIENIIEQKEELLKNYIEPRIYYEKGEKDSIDDNQFVDYQVKKIFFYNKVLNLDPEALEIFCLFKLMVHIRCSKVTLNINNKVSESILTEEPFYKDGKYYGTDYDIKLLTMCAEHKDISDGNLIVLDEPAWKQFIPSEVVVNIN